MSNPYTFNIDPETGAFVANLKQDLISDEEYKEVMSHTSSEELAELMEQDSFDVTEYFRDRDERDQDLDEKRNGFRGVSRRNDAWDKKEKDFY